jgi:hypothetical protein
LRLTVLKSRHDVQLKAVNGRSGTGIASLLFIHEHRFHRRDAKRTEKFFNENN